MAENQVSVSVNPTPVVDPAEAPQSEQLILGKFKTQDDLANAYKELEKKLGTKPAETPNPAPQGEQTPPVQPTPQNQSAEIDFNSLETEFATNGKLSDESYALLEKSGIKRAAADKYIEGRRAYVAQQENAILADVGGKEGYSKLVEWAAAGGMTPQEVEAYNAAMDSGDTNQIKLAVSGLKAKHTASFGVEPNLVQGARGSSEVGFRSTAEMMAAISDPRYEVDSAYRADVERRIELM